MVRIASILSLAGLTILAGLACSPAPPNKVPEEITAKGMVNLDGKPLKAGEIAFSQTGMPERKSAVTDGAFSSQAYPGVNKVEIRVFKDGPPASTDPKGPPTKINTLPAKWNTDSKLEAKVEKGAPNEFKFDVTSN